MSFDYNKLRGRIKEKMGTQDAFADSLGIGRVSLSRRLNNVLNFSSSEIYSAAKVLDIPKQEISEYFFTEKVQKREQK